MVGIVIVSHSSKIAEGVKEVALQMAKNHPVYTAGGTADGGIGTDPVRIQEAIEAANTGDGVVVLADLGSAVMSVGLAKEMIDPALAKSVKLANAPLVEGAIAATVEASMGSPLAKVLQTAHDARNMDKVE
ncbi:dihydroxyacetone kinase phosphoryl donor subunit DhaM [Pectinatus cerevisiiphilus]|uniref:phosphoenolpyruvate--glycerone phosphotransferase n=1 Tax=Pectinatus cerevisiiphilus TaxID=86956 RepID=A0A4R3K7T1_9FIRM|nr:dihydroxyacetone kinase phosphoryl donor subunit DhaM [Pectinatus cerevisiiphilus]TCS78960.1 dihydroxyacetone kinase DhaM subunit [Pectinatus cerevisiiphilus]